MAASSQKSPVIELAGFEPGYTRLLKEIQRRIVRGDWAPDTQIPSERELCELYGLSRTTIRHALSLAERQGLVARVAGRGTFVSLPHIRQDLARMTTFRATQAQGALRPARRVLHQKWHEASEETARRLQLPPGAEVFFLEVLGSANGVPMALYESQVPRSLARLADLESIYSSDPHELRSSYEITAIALGLSTLQAEQTFQVVILEESKRAVLQSAPEVAAFKVSTTFSSDDTLIETRVAHYPGDRYTFHIARDLELTPAQPVV